LGLTGAGFVVAAVFVLASLAGAVVPFAAGSVVVEVVFVPVFGG